MKGEYEHEEITTQAVLSALQGAGLRYKDGKRYILSQCPLHEDKNPSAQIFKNDWFTNCLSGCGRFHISKAFPELRTRYYQPDILQRRQTAIHGIKKVTEYKKFNLYEQWENMPLIPRDHIFKGIPLETLDDLGWRWDKNSYFIPYFSADRKSIPFAQWRHLSGERRFTFLAGAEPTVYGKWNLIGIKKIFVVEGTSDMAVLEYCAVPCVAMPSAASGKLMAKLATYCLTSGIELVYAGDNDDAGDKLREALDEIMPYHVCQPPKKYKDWGIFFEAEGALAVVDWTMSEFTTPEEDEIQKVTEAVMELFPGSVQLEIAPST